jgi:hypothetical protein
MYKIACFPTLLLSILCWMFDMWCHIHTRQSIYVKHNIGLHSCSNCCTGTTISIAYSECVFVASSIQHAMRMCLYVIWKMSSSATFLHIILWMAQLLTTIIFTIKVCFDFLYSFCLNHFSFSEEMGEIWTKMCISLHVMYLSFLSDFNGAWIFLT